MVIEIRLDDAHTVDDMKRTCTLQGVITDKMSENVGMIKLQDSVSGHPVRFGNCINVVQ